MSKPRPVSSLSIDVVGADANNLKNVDVTFPLKRISVVTGLSGSGKSSLLADTLAAEGSRRMRIFLGTSQQELERDDVRAFIGALPPTILVGQRGFRPNVRTTVGTATGFLSVLRRLFVLASTPYSEHAKEPVPPPSPESFAHWISKHYRGPAEIWAVPIRQQRTDGVTAVRRLASHGIEQIIIRSETDPPRLRESGREAAASGFKGLNPNVSHTIEALVGMVEVTGNGASECKRLKEILERAFPVGSDCVVMMLPAAGNPDLAGPFGPRLDSAKHWVHPADPAVFARPSPHLLSFNAPEHDDSGACRSCGGTGIGRQLREALLIAHPDRSMHDGAFAIWTEKNYKYVHIQHNTIEGLRGMNGFSPDMSWSKLPASARDLVLSGSGDGLVFDRDRSGRKIGVARPFAGFRKIILEKSSTGTKIAEQLAAFVEAGPCEACGGTRWSFQARALRVGGQGIGEILGRTFEEVEALAAVRGELARAIQSEMRPLVEAIRRHAHSIVSVGLGYLTGDRGMLDVSEGESRRIRLARVLDAGERGLCLLLDEPARGLHEADLSRLVLALERLRGEHTIILNEHRERLWDAADWHVEVGPGAGASGGEITYAGARRKRSGHDDEPLRTSLSVTANQPKITIRGASIHNVHNIDCEIPLGRLTCISGVSGSGKSSFIRGVLAPALLQSIGGTSDFALRRGHWRSISGTSSISEVVALDQAMPPPNRRSLVATFTDVFDDIRKVFGASPAAKRDGLTPSDFGVNAGNGRCPICLGVGEVIASDLSSVCPMCGGSRYGQAALSVRIAGVNVQELLATPVEHLSAQAETFRIPQRLIVAMCDLGIGYVALGRRIDSLSGGEVQRLRLAMRLGAVSASSMLFILDEPAVGLHSRDVRRLATALERVLDDGRNTVVIVEHDLQLIRSADWVLELGPGSGPDGGHIIFAGPPERLARTSTPTGLALAGKLPIEKSATQVRESTARERKLPLDEQVARTTALMRTLISGDATVAPVSDDGSAEPIVVVSERFWSGRDGWEVAGLDREIPKLLLDVHQTSKEEALAELLAEWRTDRDCWLAIQPFLTDMQVWGAELPASVIHAVTSHVSREGLRLVTVKGDPVRKDFDVRQVRATGERLVPEHDSDEACLRVLRDAFAVGARYVELRDRSGRLRATASNRLLDLEAATIAPMVLVASHFSRLDPRGRCPMCQGSRAVTALSESLVIGNCAVPPDSEYFLTPEANAVLKGIRRNELNPFLRRFAKEGLWDLSTSFERLDPGRRHMILFGFWSRPGAGSFLKSPRSDRAEGASWLRWDGLYRHTLDQADRSRDPEWARRLRESAHPVRCLRCDGSGLQLFANLLQVGDVSLADWARLSDPDRMIKLLHDVVPQTPRQKRTQQRILHCLSPLARARTSAAPATVVERAVESFTTMTTTGPDEPEAD
jgi:excinuclease ABC A subunit